MARGLTMPHCCAASASAQSRVASSTPAHSKMVAKWEEAFGLDGLCGSLGYASRSRPPSARDSLSRPKHVVGRDEWDPAVNFHAFLRSSGPPPRIDKPTPRAAAPSADGEDARQQQLLQQQQLSARRAPRVRRHSEAAISVDLIRYGIEVR